MAKLEKKSVLAIDGGGRSTWLLQGVELAEDRQTKDPAEEAGAELTRQCLAILDEAL